MCNELFRMCDGCQIKSKSVEDCGNCAPALTLQRRRKDYDGELYGGWDDFIADKTESAILRRFVGYLNNGIDISKYKFRLIMPRFTKGVYTPDILYYR